MLEILVEFDSNYNHNLITLYDVVYGVLVSETKNYGYLKVDYHLCANDH